MTLEEKHLPNEMKLINLSDKPQWQVYSFDAFEWKLKCQICVFVKWVGCSFDRFACGYSFSCCFVKWLFDLLSICMWVFVSSAVLSDGFLLFRLICMWVFIFLQFCVVGL